MNFLSTISVSLMGGHKMVGTVNKIILNLFQIHIHAALTLKPEVGATSVRTLIQPHPQSREMDGHSRLKRLLPHDSGLSLYLQFHSMWLSLCDATQTWQEQRTSLGQLTFTIMFTASKFEHLLCGYTDCNKIMNCLQKRQCLHTILSVHWVQMMNFSCRF